MTENLDGLDAGEREQAQRARESIDRRMADQELVRMLAEDGFEGRRYEAFIEDLARYALSVLRGWMYSGYVFKLVAQRGYGLHPTDAELDELRVDSELRQDLADMTVTRALLRFRQRALLEGGWAFEGGASISGRKCGGSLPVEIIDPCSARRLVGALLNLVRLPVAVRVAVPLVCRLGRAEVCTDSAGVYTVVWSGDLSAGS